MIVRSNPSGSPRRHPSLLALAGATLLLGACTLDMNKVADIVNDGLEDQLKVDIASVACPTGERQIKQGDSFECNARTAAGSTVTVAVEQTDDRGTIQWEAVRSEGLYDVRKIEATVVEGVRNHTGVATTVDCGEAPWREGKVGDTFQCSVALADGRNSTAVISLTSPAGDISWAVE
jgi:hypothetical protein